MCGIAGVLNLNGEASTGGHLRSMIDAVHHRGPDSTGSCSHGPMGLAHSRLSIIDLSGGHQPMSSDDGSLWITFNGEIFNYIELRSQLIELGHRFATESDTEVILHMYAEKGERCVEEFIGQWAFAIWDSKRQKLFLSRDRLGVRPLFFAKTSTQFVFASEIKSLFAHPEIQRDFDLAGLNQVFTLWCTLPGRTVFKGVQEVLPGHSLSVERGQIRTWPYWELDYSGPDSRLSEEECAERILELLRDATRIRLRSDVPVGAYLSGGFDSSVIAAIAREFTGSRLKTFSVAFEDPEFDESRYQRDVVNLLGTDHRSVCCSHQDICDAFPDVIRHTATPILRTAPAPLFILSRLVQNDGYKVVLTGEGSDEFFGGYDIFKESKLRRFSAVNLESRFRPLLLKRLYPYLPNIQAQSGSYLKAFFHVSESDLSNPFFSHLPRWELTSRLKMFFSDEVKSQLDNHDVYAEIGKILPDSYARWDGLSQAQYLEAACLLPGYILSSQGDRMAMAHSVEGRFPFLDHRLVEFTTRIPAKLRMRVLNEKYILKRAAGHLVPKSVAERPKQPYRAPDAASFFDLTTGKARAEYVNDLLSEHTIRKSGLFKPMAVRKLVEKASKGQVIGAKDNMALVGILSTQLLHAQFIAN